MNNYFTNLTAVTVGSLCPAPSILSSMCYALPYTISIFQLFQYFNEANEANKAKTKNKQRQNLKFDSTATSFTLRTVLWTVLCGLDCRCHLAES